MPFRVASCWVATGLILATTATAARGAELAEDRFSDWTFYNDAGWRAAERGDLEEAVRRFNAAINRLKPQWERAPLLMARSYADLAWTLYRQKRPNDAEPAARWALKVRIERAGPQSEPAAQSYYELALIQLERQEVAEAESLLRQSVAAWEKCVGPYDLRVSFYLTELAKMLVGERKFDEAEAVYRRVLGMPDRTLPPRHPFRIISIIGLGRIYLVKGEPLRAESQNKQLAALLQTLSRNDALEIAGALNLYLEERRKEHSVSDDGLLDTVSQPIVALLRKESVLPPTFRRKEQLPGTRRVNPGRPPASTAPGQ